jgi:hypothetical protein
MTLRAVCRCSRLQLTSHTPCPSSRACVQCIRKCWTRSNRLRLASRPSTWVCLHCRGHGTGLDLLACDAAVGKGGGCKRQATGGKRQEARSKRQEARCRGASSSLRCRGAGVPPHRYAASLSADGLLAAWAAAGEGDWRVRCRAEGANTGTSYEVPAPRLHARPRSRLHRPGLGARRLPRLPKRAHLIAARRAPCPSP